MRHEPAKEDAMNKINLQGDFPQIASLLIGKHTEGVDGKQYNYRKYVG
jgi:hypothetical protein